jgi:hypothetical protein
MIPNVPFMPSSRPQSSSFEGNGFSRDLTDQNLGDLMPTAGKGGLNIQFFYVRVQVSSANPDRNGQWQTRLCVAKMPKGDRLTVATRFITETEAARQFPREWAMFKQYEDVPTDGTPLQELPGITQSQVAMLIIHGLRSIEDVAELSSDIVNTMGLDVSTVHKLARRWVERQASEAGLIKAARDDAKEQSERDALVRRLDAAEKSNAELAAMVKILQQGGAAAPQVQHAMASAGSAVAVDRPDDPAEIAGDEDDGMFDGGLVDEDDDPLGVRGGE